MSNEFPAVKTTCTMGFTIQSILEENEDLLKRNPLVAAKEKDNDPWTSLDAQAAFLGPNIWGMSPTSGDLKLDYADLEGLLDDSELLGGSAVAGLGLSAPASPGLSAPVSPGLSAPIIPGLPAPVSPGLSAPVSPGLSAPVSPAMLLASPDQPVAAPPTPAVEPEPTRIDSVPLTPAASTPTTHQPDAEATSNTGRGRRGRVPRVPVRFEVSPSELALATRPGVDFHPQTHHFSDDELKPQPMCRKSKKQVVPEHRKDQKYWSRRDRNNSAAKRSREARRLKENQIALRAKFLEKENIAMQETMDEITRENERLKARLSACSCH